MGRGGGIRGGLYWLPQPQQSPVPGPELARPENGWRCRFRGCAIRLQAGAGARSRLERWCTVKYMFLLYANKALDELRPDEARQLFEDWNSATTQMAEAGVLIDCGPLQPPTAATTVQVRDGETLLTDGPAAEIKEHFGGFTLIEG